MACERVTNIHMALGIKGPPALVKTTKAGSRDAPQLWLCECGGTFLRGISRYYLCPSKMVDRLLETTPGLVGAPKSRHSLSCMTKNSVIHLPRVERAGFFCS